MDSKHWIYDLQLRIAALELLLIQRGETTKECLESFRKEAEQNHYKAQEEFGKMQWAKIKSGNVIEYELNPTSRLVLEVITTSPEPFQYLAGIIISKIGKSRVNVGEIYTTHMLSKIILHSSVGSLEIISRE